jgi:hypothetical protein
MSFGGWSIDEIVFNWIKNNLDSEKLLIEIGSGQSTEELIKKWNVISIEEDIEWVNKFHKNYIHAPIKDNWYDFDVLKANLPKKIDGLIVDGPAKGSRMGFADKIEFFIEKNPEIIIFDDTNRIEDKECFLRCLNFLKNQPEKYEVEVHIIDTPKGVSCLKIKYK